MLHLRLIVIATVISALGIYAPKAFSQITFTDIGAGLTGGSYTSLAWGDYDNDGDLDLVHSGGTATNPINGATQLYRNDGNDVFVDTGSALIQVFQAGLAWGDYDGDNDLDLVISGIVQPPTNFAMRLYRNDGEATFTSVSSGLPLALDSDYVWGDYDNDGDLDLAVAGNYSPAGIFSKVFGNDGLGTFSEMATLLDGGVQAGQARCGDYDNDGDLDLALTGTGSGGSGYFSRVFRNDGNSVFTDIDAALIAVQRSSLDWGDYDNDGDLDLALSGSYGSPCYSKIYRNDGADVFADIGAPLINVNRCSLDWGDYDNDGDLDLVLAGYTESYTGTTKIYRNDGAGVFIDSGIALIGVGYPGVSWGDYDSDGDLDLVVGGTTDSSGAVCRIYRNDCPGPNTSPSPPANLASTTDSCGSVTFSWNAATDPETPSPGLSYNLRVGTTPGGNDVCSGMAEPVTGRRLLPELGNAQKRLSWTLHNLPQDPLHWSVQAIDTSFCGSLWAPEQSTLDCNSNAIRDACDIEEGTSEDCQGNGIPDECDIAEGTSQDVDENGVPDECEADCNNNGIPDGEDLLSGSSPDCNGNLIPDECDIDPNDPDENGLVSPDCQPNGIPDECDLDPNDPDEDGSVSEDCDENEVPDECQPSGIVFVNANAAGQNRGTSWDDAFIDLQAALTFPSPPCLEFTEVWVAGGQYTPAGPGGDRTASFELRNGLPLYGGFAGGETSLDERDPVINLAILSGDLNGDDDPGFANNAENSYRVVTASDTDETAILDGFVITAGNADGTFPYYDGGGFYCGVFSSPRIANCTIARNAASNRGGAVFFHWGSSPTLTNCTISGNTATASSGGDGHGGGLFCYEGSLPTMDGCRISGNSALAGGGAYNDGGSGPAFLNCTVAGNRATNGGAVYCVESNSALTNCTLIGNSAGNDGGGIYCGGNSTTTLTNSILWGDTAGQRARELFLAAGSSLTVSYCNVQHGQTAVYAAPGGTLLWDDASVVDHDPLLTPDGHLRAGSPCADLGDPNFVADPNYPADIDGEDRVLDGVVDLGADEFLDSDADGIQDWWETRYFGAPTAADPNDDSQDQDGLTNLQEYELYSSNPIAPALHVDDDAPDDPGPGDPNVSDPLEDGSLAHPFDSIQEALDAAAAGDTVLVASGTYTGDGNRDLSYQGKAAIVRAESGPETAAIDCGATDRRAIDPDSIKGAFAALEGFTVRNGVADFGGAVRADQSRLMLKNCVLVDNNATAEGGGLYSDLGAPTVDSLTIQSNTAPNGNGGVISKSSVNLQGALAVDTATLVVRSSWLDGPGSIDLAQDALLHVTGAEPGAPPTVIRTDIEGTGNIQIDIGQRLRMEGAETVVDLSGYTGGGCADPNQAGDWGTITIDGTLTVRDATIQNTNVAVTLADFEGDTDILNNNITLLEWCTGYGGQFFAEGSALIRCNYIVSYGDRYLDLDPDPEADPNEGPTIVDNKFAVIITQGISRQQGELLELRSEDQDHDVGSGLSGAYELAASAGYDGTWALERLEVLGDPNEGGAKVSLTNRQGFVFQDPNSATPEALYVKQLKLHPGAVLNAGMQRLYYQQLVDENDAPLLPPDPNDPSGVVLKQPDPNDPNTLVPHGSRIVDTPLLGFSLKMIKMENDEEFAVRVQKRLRDPSDNQPEIPPFYEGSITREPDPNNPTNGVMVMRTQAPDALSASSVAAHGAFARAGDEDITITFRYLFVQNPAAELIVYLTDAPGVGENSVEVARLYPPRPGRAGSIGSGEFATFYATFPRGNLNFTRGTYVELELRGEDAIVWIDDWDPQIICLACADLNGTTTVDAGDYLLALAEFGQDLDIDDPNFDYNRVCLDNGLSGDNYVGINDLLAWDLFLSGETLNACSTGLDFGRGGRDGTPVTLPPGTQLLIAGKPNGEGLQEDYLYPLNANAACLGNDPLRPASVPHDTVGYRANGQLLADGDGQLYQIHGLQGLIRLDGTVVIAPNSATAPTGDLVYVGANVVDNDLYGVPLSDVAFDPNDPNVAYVVPVVVDPADGDPPYKAAAKLHLQGDGSFTVEQLYGEDPADDPRVTSWTDPYGRQVYEPDFHRLREIEVDAYGNVFVTSAHALNANDWVLIYDQSGNETCVLLGTGAPDCCSYVNVELDSPAAMRVSSKYPDTLYLSRAVEPATDGSTCVFRFSITRDGEVATGLANDYEFVNFDNPTPPLQDPNSGYSGTITAIAEDSSTGRLYVTGFTLARFAPDLPPSDPAFDPETGSIFTLPTFGEIAPDTPWASEPTIAASELICHDLALPMSLVIAFGAPDCPGDLNYDGYVNLSDLAQLLGNYGMTSGATYEQGDMDPPGGDGDVDLSDLAALLGVYGTTCE